ncbi:MAG: hypothetical protein ABI806_25375, partial [Candidatus Solibacter sp.]
ISVGGQPVPDKPTGKVTSQGIVDHSAAPDKKAKVKAAPETLAKKGTPAPEKHPVGGGGDTDKSALGSGAPLSGVVVIGPIVIGYCAPKDGDGGKEGGGGDTDKSALGSGAPLSGVTVIGPIVIGVGTGETGAAPDADNPPPKQVTIHPTEEE